MEAVMNFLDSVVGSVNTLLWDNLLMYLLVATGIYFTFRLRFIQVRKFGTGMKALFGNFSLNGGSNGAGLSSFQALTTAIAAQVGTGNIAGAATAIASGGPGAIFWMWVSAFFGMATIYSEAVLAQHTKKVVDGVVTGGPVYYIKAVFKGKFGKFLAGFFSVAIILALGFMGNMVQSNSIGDSFHNAFGVNPLIVGICVAVVAAVIFIGGVKRIAWVTEKIVPVMALFYIVGCAVILCMCGSDVGLAFKQIFVMAFNPQAMAGGALGITVQKAMRFGVARGLFSNEAGMGSAPNASASASVSHPAKQGMVQVLSVFIDTLLICSATAMMLLLSGVQGEPGVLDGIPFVQKAISANVGSWGIHFITISIFAFAFSSLIGNYYYAESNILFIKNNKTLLLIFRISCLVAVFLGAQADFSMMWNIADITMGCMATVNILVILVLGNVAIKVLKDYEKQRKEGKDPVFKAKDVGIDHTDCW